MSSHKLLIDIPAIIAGPRVLIRSFMPGDGVALFEAVQESREYLRPWIPWADSHQTLAESEEVVRRGYGQFILREDLMLGMFEKESGRLLGGSGLHRIDWTVRSFEIGYWIRSSEEGKGYVTESVELITALAFDVLSANRVFIRCAEANTRSWAIPERLGYFHEGTLLNQVIGSNGDLQNMKHYVMTPDMWRQRKARRGDSGLPE